MRVRLVISIAVLLLASAANLYAQGSFGLDHNPPPEGYNAVLLLLGNGEIALDEPLFTDGAHFFENIMGWNPAQTEEFRQRALNFLAQRFGIEDAENHPDIAFADFQTNPATRYRAYEVSGRRVPESGWEVREGGFNVFVTNPEGLTLGGEFAGVHVAANTIFGFGIYNLEVTDLRGQPTGEEMIIEFQSNQPIQVTNLGSFGFVCDVYNEEWGYGLGQGSAAGFLLGEGDETVFKNNFRNVMTFSELGGL